jgi:hypothetical protein
MMNRKSDNDCVVECSSGDCCSCFDNTLPMTKSKQLLSHSGILCCCVAGDPSSSVYSQSSTSEKAVHYVNHYVKWRRCGGRMLRLVVVPACTTRILLSALVALLLPIVSSSLSSIPQHQPNDECNLYLAPSTIPGAGSGMFLGSRPVKEGDRMAPPDIMMSTYDLEWNNGNLDFDFLWDEYTWSTCKFCGMVFNCKKCRDLFCS